MANGEKHSEEVLYHAIPASVPTASPPASCWLCLQPSQTSFLMLFQASAQTSCCVMRTPSPTLCHSYRLFLDFLASEKPFLTPPFPLGRHPCFSAHRQVGLTFIILFLDLPSSSFLMQTHVLNIISSSRPHGFPISGRRSAQQRTVEKALRELGTTHQVVSSWDQELCFIYAFQNHQHLAQGVQLSQEMNEMRKSGHRS